MQKLAAAVALGLVFAMGAAQADEGHLKKLEAKFKAADKDGDGTLDKAEAAAMPGVAKNFEAIDSDKDGTVTLEEIHSGMHAKAKEMHARGEAKFKAADKDNDGTLDKAEAAAMPRVAKNFDAIDTDKDGTVSREEIHAFMKTMKEKHGGMHDDMHGGKK
jgi:Ca2+-binding EF-hand superfamily protein